MINMVYLTIVLLIGLIFLWFSMKPVAVGRIYTFTVFTFVILIAGLGYWQWGGMPQWVHYQMEQARAKQAKAIMQQVKTPEALVQRLKETIHHSPHPAQGWYLLGRVYASQGKWRLAMGAFAHAIALKPNIARYHINYIDAKWNVGSRHFSSQIHQDLEKLLQNFPNQPDAMVMLATEAYQNKQYLVAIQYWQKLLAVTPANSEAASMLRRAIAKAEKQQATLAPSDANSLPQ